MKKWELARFVLVLAFILFLYLSLITRLFYWQIIRAEELKELGERQSSEVFRVPAVRGEIFSSDNFPLATNTVSHILYSNPKVVKDKEKSSEILSTLLNQDEASISALLEKDLFWVKIAGNLSGQTKKEIENLKLPGFGFQQEFSRFYPEASMAAHLIGFVGKDESGQNHGYFGIEGKYNEQLEGRSGKIFSIRDAFGNKIVNDLREDKKIDGRSVKLALDRSIQFFTEKRLRDGLEKYNAEGGSAIVMDTASGAILAMSSIPSFDPKKYYRFDSDTYINPVLSDLYEPGSTFKVLIMAGAIDSNLVKRDTKCDVCQGPIQMGEYKIRTWNDKYFTNPTMNDVIVHSDNTGMVFVGRKLGLKRMIDYLKKFGLGQPSGIDLQGETTGYIRSEKSWRPIDLATASFGQGISATPIQLISAVNSVANGGKLMQPYVVSEIITEDGKKIVIKPEVRNRTISQAAAKMITSMMVDAVENGEAKWTKVKNYKIAGKTGTAQIPVAGHYDPNQTIASFVGFFPADNPRVTMLILINRPKTSIYGSETAAPIFFNIARDIIKYYNLPPN